NLLFPQHSIGKKDRNSKAVFLGAEIPLADSGKHWKKAVFRPAIRYEKYFDQPWRWYPTLGLSLVPPFIPPLTLSGSWYKAVRYPDFNSLFWKGDSRARGNPQLQPERKQAWNISAHLRPPGKFSPVIAATYYSEKIEDLIYWHRGVNGVWEPRNEEQAEKNGLDLEVRQPIFPEHLNLQIAYGYISAINKTDEINRFNKRLIFIPEHTLNTALWFNVGALQGQVVYRYLSERETVFSNSAGTQLAPYSVWDVLLSYPTNVGGITLEPNFAIKNLTGTNYQLLFGYPMPGREFQITLIVKLNTL
ncbi:MAG: TonB-dependent receptor, partial [Calditrichia bacterium]